MNCRRWPAFLLVLALSGVMIPLSRAEDKPPSDKPAADADSAAPAKTDKPDAAKEAAAARAAADEEYELYQVFADTLDQVERNYVKKVDRRELMEAAIHGILGKLDPYSNYISPDDLSRFKTSVEQQFGGIGIQITIDHEQLKVLSPIVGSPAYKAGLQAGDAIVEIEGKSTDGITLDDAVRKLKGEAGSSVTMTIVHPGSGKREPVTIKREIIHMDTVMGDLRKDSGAWDFMLDKDHHIGYVRITAFSRETAHELKRALEDLKSQGLKGLIVDLRFNPGGLLTSAIEISDMFISEGRIVSTKGRNTPQRTWDATKEGTYEGFPVAVLVNRYSASASEIFSACLQDHHRAVIIGERTWGKGSVQNVIELENGKSALKLTTASYQRPSGKNIHRFPDAKESDEWGVMPDKGYDMRLPDRELADLMKYRRERDIFNPTAKAESPAQQPVDREPGEPEAASEPSKPSDNKADVNKTGKAEGDKNDKGDGDKSGKADVDKNSKPDGDKSDGDKSGKVDGDKADSNKSGSAKLKSFSDRQLQKAIDYLSQELARAQ